MTEWLKELGLLDHLLHGVLKLVLKKRPKPSGSVFEGTHMNKTPTDYVLYKPVWINGASNTTILVLQSLVFMILSLKMMFVHGM